MLQGAVASIGVYQVGREWISFPVKATPNTGSLDPRTPKLADLPTKPPAASKASQTSDYVEAMPKPDRLKCGAQKEYEIHCDVHRDEYGLAVGALAM